MVLESKSESRSGLESSSSRGLVFEYVLLLDDHADDETEIYTLKQRTFERTRGRWGSCKYSRAFLLKFQKVPPVAIFGMSWNSPDFICDASTRESYGAPA